MRTIVVSDTHLGMASRRDVLRHEGALRALADGVRGADHVVLLGDVIELREASLHAALADAEPFFRLLGEAVGDARVTIVPGNHDHRLAAPLVEQRRLEGAPLVPDRSEPAPATGPLATIAGWLGHAELRLAYPGLRLRHDVYATHGHYLDCHAAIPTLERLAVALTERVVGRPRPGAPADDYEAAVVPLYDLTYALAQSDRGRRLLVSDRSASVWKELAARRDGRRRIGPRVFERVVLPAAVGTLNRAGLGPLTSDLSGPSLRRSALAAMATVAADLGVDDAHVIFGHTHRAGPWPRDDASEWQLRNGGRLLNTGSWIHEPAFLGPDPAASPYRPGNVAVVEDEDPPRLERLLDELPTGT